MYKMIYICIYKREGTTQRIVKVKREKEVEKTEKKERLQKNGSLLLHPDEQGLCCAKTS